MQSMFTTKDLKKLIIPLIIEQLLGVTVGMADIVMVSAAGEAAVSGISLVDTINILLIQVFSAMATGGAVISAQYIGRRDQAGASRSADQLMLSVTVLAIIISAAALAGNRYILQGIYGNIGTDVMDNAVTYFYLTALSFPFLGIYNAGAALCRSMGNSKVSMKISFVMNLLNICGNMLLIYGLHMGSAGAGVSTLTSRLAAAVLMYLVIHNQDSLIHLSRRLVWKPDFKMIREILAIGIPAGLENSIFQIGKLLLSSLVSTFGTAAIAANAVTGSVAGLQCITGSAMGLALITVGGQCVGAGCLEEATRYVKKFLKLVYISMGLINLSVILFIPGIVGLFSLSPEAQELAKTMMFIHGAGCILIWPASFVLPNAMRAAGDAKFPMVVSVVLMWVCRIGMAYVFAIAFDFEAVGVWLAMMVDWTFRAIIFLHRIYSGKWLKKAAGNHQAN